jgi:hypothetical protein
VHLAAEFLKSGIKAKKLHKIQKGYQKTQNFMVILKSLDKFFKVTQRRY